MTTSRPWLVYGANGYTGQLVAEEAMRRGHRPVLAGRNEAKIRPLAEKMGLPWKAFGLDDISAAAKALEDVDLVFHAAGPFVHTSEPMITACLARGAHYVDVTGEIPVFARTLDRDEEAKRAKVCLISGVGFDVIPTDCLARFVGDKLPHARHLDIAFAALGTTSPGTTKTMLEMIARGNLVRREGALLPAPLGADVRTFRFADKERGAVSIPWGDLETAYKTTGIPNITTYMSLPRAQLRAMKLFGSSISGVLKRDRVRDTLSGWAERFVKGPDETARNTGRWQVYAAARDAEDRKVEAWLTTPEGYAFTARGGVLAVERLLASDFDFVGATTPALAFGADFVLAIEGTQRFESLP
ncbi:MAG: saccharopine dehydrogenase NADP-binding domain-containing protein [Polyangiaceae bacterium]